MQYFEILLIDVSRYAISNESLECGFQRLVNIKCFFSSGLRIVFKGVSDRRRKKKFRYVCFI